MPKLKKPRGTSASHRNQAAILRVLIEDGAVLQRDLPEKTGIDNKGLISRELSSLRKYIEIKGPVLLSDYLKAKRYAGKNYRGYIITLRDDFPTYQEISRKFPALLGALMKSPSVLGSIKRAYTKIYNLDKDTEALFESALALVPTFFQWHLEDNPQVVGNRIRGWYPIAGEGCYLGDSIQSFGRGSAFDHLVVGDHGNLIPLHEGELLSEPVLKSLTLKAAYNDFIRGQLTDEGLEFVKGLEEVPDLVRSAKGEIADVFDFERVRKILIEIAPLLRSDLAEDIVRSVPVWKKLCSEGNWEKMESKRHDLMDKYPGLKTLMVELW